MAYGKRKYSQRLPYGAYKFGQSMARQLRFAKRQEALQEAALAASAVASQAGNNLQVRRDAAIAMGRGAYGLGDKIRRMAGSRLGKAVRRGIEYGINQTPFASDYQGLKAAVAPQGQGLYTGMGAYQSNDLIDGNLNDPIPDFGGDSPEAGIIVSKKEYVSEIYGPARIGTQRVGGVDQAIMPAFEKIIVPINPGLERCFPWLSQLAANYTEYEQIQLIFTFVSTIVESSNTSNGQVGQIVMATQYNTTLPPYANMQQMLQANSPSKGKITDTQYHGVECDPSANSGTVGKYIRTGPVPPYSSDPSKFDVGFLQIGLCNIDRTYENVSLGQLYVSYTVRLRKPRLQTTLGNTITKDIFVSKDTGSGTNAVMGLAENVSTAPAYPKTVFKNTLKGQQNNLGVRLTYEDSSVYPVAGVPTNLSNATILVLTFPASYAGNVKIMLTVAGGPGGATCSLLFGSALGQPIAYRGNVSAITDLYGVYSGAAVGDTPQTTILQSDSVAGSATLGSFVLVTHCRVDVATNGSDNAIVFPLQWQASFAVTQAYLEVGEYNGSFSGKALNVNTDDAPIFVNMNSLAVEVPI